jgi:His/Glu/Gln/Arg/opine family amino acid ABC transporter permease subunit
MFAVSFDTHLFLQRVFSPDHVFVRAMLTTLYIAVSAQIIGVIIGLFAALARQSSSRALRGVAFVYALAIRGTPVLVQIFFLYYGANLFFGVDLFPRTADFGLFSLAALCWPASPRWRSTKGPTWERSSAPGSNRFPPARSKRPRAWA